MNYLIIALGGSIGSALRYAVSKFVQDSTNGAFPYHTFAVNIVGCLLIGLFYDSLHADTLATTPQRCCLPPACVAASPRSPRSATRTSHSCVATTLSSPYSTSPAACSADCLPLLLVTLLLTLSPQDDNKETR